MLIKVKTFPCSRELEIIKQSENSFEVKIKEKPVMGQANRAIVAALAGYFKIPENKVRLVKGFRERNKIFEILI
ncbi:MAG: hypothetical protein Athens101410_326 [Parcubacteria group bacterium Athens1014_10]|nr:MAG: hypothetical protein Athens101410_326 [Parcubacteria group bacterium Athens1014_10]TSD04219.1 MAG: hypothetical protein Athens071412_783 [Parcubacteria group bacterium Athens0714_12]